MGDRQKCKCYLNIKAAARASKGLHPGYTCPVHDILPFDGAFASPMLVSEIPGHRDRIMSQDYVFVQPKLDGWRIMGNTRTRKIYTRSGREITTLPHINAALPVDGPEWLDGELWKAGANCDDVQSMVKRGDPSLEFHVFDCVSVGGFGYRMKRISDIAFNDIIKIVPTIEVPASQKGKHIKEVYKTFLSASYEGIIIRLDGHGYEHGRSLNVFKMKPGTEGV